MVARVARQVCVKTFGNRKGIRYSGCGTVANLICDCLEIKKDVG